MQTIHLLDIGTHDGQEISLIIGRHSFFGLCIHFLKLFKANQYIFSNFWPTFCKNDKNFNEQI